MPCHAKVFLTIDIENIQFKVLIKNGFDGLFWLPHDEAVLAKVVEEKLANSSEKKLCPIKLFDMDGSTKLSFEIYIYFQLNKKYIRFFRIGRAMGEERLKRLQSRDIGTVYVQKDDLGNSMIILPRHCGN